MKIQRLGRKVLWASAVLLGGVCAQRQTSACAQDLASPAAEKWASPASREAANTRIVFKHQAGVQCGDSECVCHLNEQAIRLTSDRFHGGETIRAQEPEVATSADRLIPVSGIQEHLDGAASGELACGCHGHGHYPTMGSKRVRISTFEIDSAQPSDQFRFRYDAAYGWERPDRAEFLWAKIGGSGPSKANPRVGGAKTLQAERNVDFQDFRFYTETALMDGAAAMFTDIPIRLLNPDVYDNTAGLADINVGTKTVLFEEDSYMISMYFKTYIPSGLDRRGLGTGHTSLEPGVLAQWQLDENTWLHGEFKFLFPLGADVDFGGEVLNYGFGISHLLYECADRCRSNYVAVIPSIEFVAWSVTDGRETVGLNAAGDATLTDSISGTTILNIQPGVRVLWGQHMDFGLSASFAVTNDHLYDQLIRFEWRWFF